MIKIVASHSMKVPVEGQEFSSKSFHVGLEAEVADTVGGEGILAKSHALFALARAAVNAELNGKSTPKPASEPAGEEQPETRSGNGNGDGASVKQKNFLISLARRNGGIEKLQETISRDFRVGGIEDLSRKQASELIEKLTGKGGGRYAGRR